MATPGFQHLPCLAWMWLVLGAGSEVSAATAENFDHFERHIRPVLVERCYECHSARAKSLKGGLRLDTREGMLRGGDSGQPAIVPGDPARSRLLTAIRQTDAKLQMPPKGRLASRHVTAFEEWIQSGAPDPRTAPATRPLAASPRPSHWAFVAPKAQRPPAVKDRVWPQNPIDHFILAKLESAGIKPTPPADKFTLIRRASYTLTGKPPGADEVTAFLGDSAPDAYRRLVDRLLASPGHGEHWARHWLDVARYSDTKGYVYAREERFFAHAHVYRDWVIGAFNRDLPYDQFLRLQIAADQMVAPGSADLAAMGFLTGGRRFIGVTHDIVDDRIDVMTRGALGLTVSCARCHDHKYDPIPTRDYYSLYGVLRSGVDQLVRLEPASANTGTNAAFEVEYQKRLGVLNRTMATRREETAARARQRIPEYLLAQTELHRYPEEGFDQIFTEQDILPATVRHWQAYLYQSQKAFDPIWAPWHALSALKADDFATRAPTVLAALRRHTKPALNPLVAEAFAQPPVSLRETAERYGRLFGETEKLWQTALATTKTNNTAPPARLPNPDREALRHFLHASNSPVVVPDEPIIANDQFFTTKACEELWKLQSEVDRWIIRTPGSPPHALALLDREPQLNPRVFLRGNPATPGAEVPRQFLEVLSGPGRAPFQHGSGRRELAGAIASADNPLTARVMVNRIWAQHFGAGLVRTPSDFGLRAESPSHPELLDWLAREFVAANWSVKAMHRLLLLSATYQQGSALNPAAARIDPENRLLGQMNRHRLRFEELRDSLLAGSGQLDTRMGGTPADLFARANQRRTIYGLVDRQFLPGLFRIFDFASPDLHIPQRHETTVSQQALFFLNHPLVGGSARALVEQPEIANASSATERVDRIYRAIYQRAPGTRQTVAALEFVARAEAVQPPPPPKVVETAWSYGYGEYDEKARRLKGFAPLPHFTGSAWQGEAQWPDPKLGWAQLTAEGGHAGNDLQHAVVRRWTAPRDALVTISGKISHDTSAGDGVRAFIWSSRNGQLRTATVHNADEEMRVATCVVQREDTIDFIVDYRANLNSDQFKWIPVITVLDAAAALVPVPAKVWDAEKEFGGPVTVVIPPLTPWEQLAQVLFSANEFLFVD